MLGTLTLDCYTCNPSLKCSRIIGNKVQTCIGCVRGRWVLTVFNGFRQFSTVFDSFQLFSMVLAYMRERERERERGQLECSKRRVLMVHYVLYLCLTDKGALRIYIKRWN